MKQKIDPEDILEGDLIRIEEIPGIRKDRAAEYRALEDGDTFGVGPSLAGAVHYLLERPEPPFEPYWGMVIREEGTANMAYYLPEEEGRPGTEWILETSNYVEYEDNDWAKKKLAEGWVIIEKPEGVK